MNEPLSLCPHCGGMTVLEKSARFRWVCGACGGPRIPGAPGKNAALVRARQAQAAAFGWSAGAIALAMTGAITAGLAALVFLASQPAGIAVGIVGAIMLLFAWRASARAGARRREADVAVKDGWREGTRAILAARGRDTTAAQLAGVMQIDEALADELLTHLAAHDEARVDIEDGSVKFRVDPPKAEVDAEAEVAAETEEKKEKRA